MSHNEFQLKHKTDVHLTFLNQHGSVEHYYHFLLGFFIPLVLACEKLTSSGKVRNIYIRSCSIFDDYIRDAGFTEIVILDKLKHSEIKLKGRFQQDTSYPLKFIDCVGYDSSQTFESTVFYDFSSFLNARFSRKLAQARRSIFANLKASEPKIIFINRGNPHEFYSSEHCELKSSGNQRRSINNFSQLRDDLKSVFPDIIFETLEEKSLIEQMVLFSSADIVIAQHGAALANIIWCRKDAYVIEILPDRESLGVIQSSCFQHLAESLSLEYYSVFQSHKHGCVDSRLILGTIQYICRGQRCLDNQKSIIRLPERLTRVRFSAELYPVYGDEYKLVIHKGEYYIQDGSSRRIKKLNPGAECIFDYCLGNKTIGAIADEISKLDDNDEPYEEVLNDVETVVFQLMKSGLLSVSAYKPFPEFLIIGAMKSGTSALDINLCYHSEVTMAHRENWAELNYFTDENIGLGPVWYRKHFNSKNKLQGEKSPEYLSNPGALTHLHNMLPDAKLIVLLRNPVTRAYSHWNHLNQISEESVNWGWQVCDFEEIIKINPAVLNRGYYAIQIEFLYQFYPRDQVYIGIAERFKTDGLLEYKKVCDFLGISHVAEEYRNVHVRKYISTMSKDIRVALVDHYRPYNEELFKLLGYRIQEWS